jgi:hypothetical protein
LRLMGMSHLVETTSVDQSGDAVDAFHTLARDSWAPTRAQATPAIRK